MLLPFLPLPFFWLLRRHQNNSDVSSLWENTTSWGLAHRAPDNNQTPADWLFSSAADRAAASRETSGREDANNAHATLRDKHTPNFTAHERPNCSQSTHQLDLRLQFNFTSIKSRKRIISNVVPWECPNIFSDTKKKMN